jgi:hypothetical protein
MTLRSVYGERWVTRKFGVFVRFRAPSNAALQEDVDTIGVSSLARLLTAVFPKL